MYKCEKKNVIILLKWQGRNANPHIINTYYFGSYMNICPYGCRWKLSCFNIGSRLPIYEYYIYIYPVGVEIQIFLFLYIFINYINYV